MKKEKKKFRPFMPKGFGLIQRRTMHYYAQVLLNSTPNATPSLYIRFDTGGYLINCPEGTQRFCFEHQIRLTKLKSILSTRNSWSSLGGLPGTFIFL
jgi:hypothetical protein